MRRSSVVKLTLLPMLATAAVATVATADPPTAGGGPPPTAGAPSEPPTGAPSQPPTAGGSDDGTAVAPDGGPQAGYDLPPSEAPPVLEPPGMTPSIIELSCDEDPSWRLRPDCNDDDGVYWYDGGVIRGGFGTYFYGGGGG